MISIFCYFQTSFPQILEEAKNSKPKILYESVENSTVKELILKESLDSLNLTFDNCDIDSKKSKYSCFETITSYLQKKVTNELKGTWIVTVGENLKCYGDLHNLQFHSMHFLIGDIAFDFYCYN